MLDQKQPRARNIKYLLDFSFGHLQSPGQGEIDARGAIFTRTEIVEFILDLTGYTEDQPLYRKRILEPSFGSGDFLFPVVGRLLAAWRASNSTGPIVDELDKAIRAVELHRETFTATRAA